MRPRGASPSILARVGCAWPLVGLALGLIAAVAVLGAGGLLRQPRLAGLPVAPIVVRLPAPSDVPTPVPTQVPAPTPTPPQARLDGTFLPGDLIEVHGTDGEGVRIRSDPDLNATILGLAQDGEAYQVLGGPVESAGYTWWEIARLDDQNRRGWAVGTFLRLLQ